MTVDNSKLNYYSGWDIDQLTDQGSIAVSSGTTAIFALSGAPTVPVFELLFKPTGSTYWYQPGTNSTNGTLAGTFVFYAYILNGVIYSNTTTAGTIRYYVWSDKVNY